MAQHPSPVNETADDRTHAQWRIEPGELDRHMGVRVVEETVDRVVIEAPVVGNRQSFGSLHGGASAALSEAAGSWAANLYASLSGRSAVGVDLSITHHRPAREGTIRAIATPIRLGRTVTTHDVVIEHDSGERIATARITNLVVDRPIPGTASADGPAAGRQAPPDQS